MVLVQERYESLFAGIGALTCPEQIIKLVDIRVASAPDHIGKDDVQFRASSIGRPWILQILDKWYGHKRSFTIDACMRMHQGKITQEWVAEILSLAQIPYLQEHTIKYGPVEGHADFILEGGKLVVEVKCTASRLCNAFRKAPHDDLGYISQLAFYVHASGAEEGAFLLYDRDMAKFYWVAIMPTVLQAKWDRIKLAVDTLTEIPPYDVDALLSIVAIPPTVGGKLLSSVKYSRWVDTLYQQGGDGYSIRPLEDISKQLKQLPLQRADRYEQLELF